jgi:hypothetical protein
VFIGQPRWCALLADQMQSTFGSSVREYVEVGFAHPWDILGLERLRRLLAAEVIVRVGFRPGAPTPFGRLFSAAWSVLMLLKPRAGVVWYWIGTDVSDTVQAYRDERLRAAIAREVRRGSHIAGSDSLASELATIGIDAQVAWFPAFTLKVPDVVPSLPSRYTVLSYVPDARPRFYGGPDLLELACALPDIEVRIAGGTGEWAGEVPANVTFLGWIDDMATEYEAASCVVRLVQHDAVGATAIEGLMYGRDVIYSGSLENAVSVPFGDASALIDAVRRLRAAHATFSEPNHRIAAWAAREFSQQARLCALRDLIATTAEGPDAASSVGIDD